MNDIIAYIKIVNPISFLVLATLYNITVNYKKTRLNTCLLVILLASVISEFLTVFFIISNFDICIIYNLYFIINNFFWLVILCNLLELKKVKSIVILLFLLFCLLNILFIEKLNLNYYTFIISALTYVLIFVYQCYYQLNTETLRCCKTNNFILLFAPILFFLGMSIVFSFRNSTIKDVIIFNKIELYTFITYFVDIVYYSLLNLYLFKERKK